MTGTMLKHPPRHAVGTADTPGLRCAAATPRAARGPYCGRCATQTLEHPGGTSALPPAGVPYVGWYRFQGQAEARPEPSGSNQMISIPRLLK